MTQSDDRSIEGALARCDAALAESKAHLDAFHAGLDAIEARDAEIKATPHPGPPRPPAADLEGTR